MTLFPGPARESHLVELVDADGSPTGSATVAEAHREPGQLHRAFSVFLRDPDGRVLLQQRAAVKTRFPLRWANTCCGHPEPGESLTVAAARRLAEELGVTGMPLAEVGVYSYYAEDPATGRVEYEYDHVLLGDLPAGVRPQPDPDEVADYRWVEVPTLLDEVERNPRAYAPWLAGVAGRLAEHLMPTDNDAGSGVTRRVGQEAPEWSGGR
ncbi:isopentenyl-diphosphate Delta-isomerase [Micromonosporaceae bacterium Da 78-11]